jgi:hypothetical protein
VDDALSMPEPTSTLEHELADVFNAPLRPVTADPRHLIQGARDARYLDAISDALREQMRRDPTTVLLGQDIAEYGGAFKVTAGFVEEFGKARVRNTPIIESGALGAAMGLALDGFVPMVEMQFGDFISCGFNQIVNNLAKTHYRWGGPRARRDPHSLGRRRGRGSIPLAERGVLLRERAGTEDRGAVDAVRRQGPSPRRVRGRQPRALPRAQAPLPHAEGAGAGRAISVPSKARRPRGKTPR